MTTFIIGMICAGILIYMVIYFFVLVELRNKFRKVILSGLFGGVPVKIECSNDKQAAGIYKAIKFNFSPNDNSTIRFCDKIDKSDKA